MRIGGAWIKQGDQGDFISVSIQIQFLGELNFALFPNKNKEGMQPDYHAEWNPKFNKKAEDWIIVPLDIEAEVSEVDGNWYQKRKVEL